MRKKLFAILMSAMMMVTFMPTMAFAAITQEEFTATSWDTVNYESVTGYLGADTKNVVTLPTVKVIDTTYGYIVVTPDTSKKAGVKNDDNQAKTDTLPGDKVYFYDFDLFSLAGDFGYDEYNQTQFAGLWDASGNAKAMTFKVTVPSYDTTTVTRTAFTVAESVIESHGYNVSMAKPADYVAGAYTDQTLTAVVKVVKDATRVDYTSNDPDAKGSVAAKTYKVTAATPLASTAKFYMDSVVAKNAFDASGDATVKYDGAEHAIVMADLPGATVSYQLMNDSTGKFEPVDKAVVKAAGTYVFKYAVKISDTNKASGELTVTVSKAPATTVVWNSELQLGTTNKYFSVAGDFNVTDYLTVADATKEQKAAFTADKAELASYFSDYYEVVKTPTALDENVVVVKIKEKTLTDAEKAALKTKYAALTKNYTSIAVTSAEATFVVNGGDIDWVKAPLNKTYKYKNLKKKAKSFTITAVAGAKVTYKLTNGGSKIKINKTTGKVTVKKGLKKGTYKVTVTAKAGSVSDSYVLKIKVK